MSRIEIFVRFRAQISVRDMIFEKNHAQISMPDMTDA